MCRATTGSAHGHAWPKQAWDTQIFEHIEHAVTPCHIQKLIPGCRASRSQIYIYIHIE